MKREHGAERNVVNLSCKLLCGKLLAKRASWLCHEPVLFGEKVSNTSSYDTFASS